MRNSLVLFYRLFKDSIAFFERIGGQQKALGRDSLLSFLYGPQTVLVNKFSVLKALCMKCCHKASTFGGNLHAILIWYDVLIFEDLESSFRCLWILFKQISGNLGSVAKAKLC